MNADDISTWKLSCDSAELAQVLRFMKGIDGTKIVFKLLDGTSVIQTIGEGQKYASVSIFSSRENMDTINQAEVDGAEVSAIYRSVQYNGYIEDKIDWTAEVPGEWYSGTLKLLIEEEVAL